MLPFYNYTYTLRSLPQRHRKLLRLELVQIRLLRRPPHRPLALLAPSHVLLDDKVLRHVLLLACVGDDGSIGFVARQLLPRGDAHHDLADAHAFHAKGCPSVRHHPCALVVFNDRPLPPFTSGSCKNPGAEVCKQSLGAEFAKCFGVALGEGGVDLSVEADGRGGRGSES